MFDQSGCICILYIWTFERKVTGKAKAGHQKWQNSDFGQMNDTNSKIPISQNVNIQGNVNSVYSSSPWLTEVSHRPSSKREEDAYS
jgi:spore coat protein U-like protein